LANGNIDGDDGFYETAQHFFGGALSGMSGANMASSMAGGSKSYALGKYGNKFLSYGLQGNAHDFAHTKKDKYLKKNLGQHFGTFIAAGQGGAMQSISMDNPWVNDLSPLAAAGFRAAGSMGAYYSEYQSSSAVKANFYGLESKGWQAKMGVSGYKSMFNALMLKLQ